MSESLQFLPTDLRNKTVGTWGKSPTLFTPDLLALGCKMVEIDPDDSSTTADNVDFFVLDCTPLIAKGYVTSVRKILWQYRLLAEERYCYGIFPYTTINYDWDVTNTGAPLGVDNCLPGARWLYDDLLQGFAARAVANIQFNGTVPCVVSRLVPLRQTLLCIMEASGLGKTTLVRQLKCQHNVFHTSSDYLLSGIINLRLDENSSPEVRRIKQIINAIEPDELWGRFFRLLDADEELLTCFLQMAWQHMQLAEPWSLISLDIDLRKEASRNATVSFFREKKLKVWECHT